MYLSKVIESFGTGLKRIADECDEAGIKYEFISGFTVVFRRTELWVSDKFEENIKNIVAYPILTVAVS